MKNKVFTLISLIFIVGAIALPASASPKLSQHDAVIYSRGIIDAIAPPGVWVKTISCKATTNNAAWKCIARTTDAHCLTLTVRYFGDLIRIPTLCRTPTS